MELEKWYCLYSDKKQTKFLAAVGGSLEDVKAETEYFTQGVWFEYDQRPGSNLLFNEKILKAEGIKFPTEAKLRVERGGAWDAEPAKIAEFKWVS